MVRDSVQRGFPRARARQITPSKYVHVREAYVIDITNDTPSTPDAIGVNSATPKWSPRVLYANHSYDAGSGRLQHCPKSRWDLCDDRLFHQRYPGQFLWWDCTITTLNHDYTATEPRWQSWINKMEKLSTEPRIFNKREIAVSDQPSPTDKSKAHVEAVYRNTHHEVDREVYWDVDQSSPTDKPTAHREAVYPDTHWEVYREVYRHVCQVDQDST